MGTEGQTEETTNEAAGAETPPETETPVPVGDAPPGENAAPGEDAEARADGENQEQPRPEEKHRRQGGWQRKIERLEREREILLQQLQAQGQQPPATQGKEKTTEERAAEVIDALVDQRIAAREAQNQQRAAQAAFQQRTQAVRASHPDFDEVVMGVEHIRVPPALQQALLTSENGPEIMYQLASNPDELARIASLPPIDAAREIGRLEARASATAAPRTQPRAATRPPAPPTNVNGSAPSTRSLESLPMAEYKRAFRSKGGR